LRWFRGEVVVVASRHHPVHTPGGDDERDPSKFVVTLASLIIFVLGVMLLGIATIAALMILDPPWVGDEEINAVQSHSEQLSVGDQMFNRLLKLDKSIIVSFLPTPSYINSPQLV